MVVTMNIIIAQVLVLKQNSPLKGARNTWGSGCCQGWAGETQDESGTFCNAGKKLLLE